MRRKPHDIKVNVYDVPKVPVVILGTQGTPIISGGSRHIAKNKSSLKQNGPPCGNIGEPKEPLEF